MCLLCGHLCAVIFDEMTIKEELSYSIEEDNVEEVEDLQSLLQLWDDLRKTNEVKLLHTSRLNKDCLENRFSVIRGRGGQGGTPSPRQYLSAPGDGGWMVSSCGYLMLTMD